MLGAPLQLLLTTCNCCGAQTHPLPNTSPSPSLYVAAEYPGAYKSIEQLAVQTVGTAPGMAAGHQPPQPPPPAPAPAPPPLTNFQRALLGADDTMAGIDQDVQDDDVSGCGIET